MTKKAFPTIQEMDDMYKKHVLYEKRKNAKNLKKYSMQWLKTFVKNKIPYEVNWLGIPAIQFPEDMIIMQELIYRTRPEFIIETGIAHGGSVVFYASILELLQSGEVIGIDREIRSHNRILIEKHPLSKRITLIEGSSIEKAVVDRCNEIIGDEKNVLVILDSDHSRLHVLHELEIYAKFLSKGNYIVVQDTAAYYLAKAKYPKKYWERYDWLKEGAKNAVDEFLSKHKEFKQDTYYEKFFITCSMGGFLKKIN